MYSQEDLLPISALQHLMFCERQAALIHIEQVWEENVLTVQGRQLHEHVHEQEANTLKGVRIVRSLNVRSLSLGLVGITDVVEFHQSDESEHSVSLAGLSGHWAPFIIEYKRGKPKIDRSDEIQLCAQVLCLEEMLDVSIPESGFFYGTPRRRHVITIGEDLRRATVTASEKLHRLILEGKTPPAKYTKKCGSCSLIDQCMPKLTERSMKVQQYLKTAFIMIEEEEQ